MTNVNSFDVGAIMREISKAAPLLLLASAAASFFLVGVFFVDYYSELYPRRGNWAHIAMAVFHELVRFSLLLATIKDFSDERKFNGWLGLLGSVGLVFYDIHVAEAVAVALSPDNPLAYSSGLIFLILVGFGLELRLALTVDLKKKLNVKKPQAASNGQAAKNTVFTAAN